MLNGRRKVCIDLNCGEEFKIVSPNSHVNHQSITVDQLQTQLLQWYTERKYKCSDLCQNYLISFIKNNFDQLRSLLNQLEQSLIKYKNLRFNAVLSSYYSQINLESFEVITNQLKTIYQQNINNLKDEELNEIMKIRLRQDYIEQLILIKNNIECKAYRSFMCISKNIRTNIQVLDLALDLNQQSQTPVVMKWSQKMKSEHIELQKENLIALHSSFKNDCMVLSEFPINCIGISQIAINIINSGYFIALGLADMKIQQTKNFEWDMSQLKGSGLFLLINNGQTFMDTSSVFNMDKKPFTYEDNDIIYVIFNSSTDTLKFSKNEESFAIRISSPINELRFCACLYGAQIEIIEP